jgi:hypothetical protein
VRKSDSAGLYSLSPGERARVRASVAQLIHIPKLTLTITQFFTSNSEPID